MSYLTLAMLLLTAGVSSRNAIDRRREAAAEPALPGIDSGDAPTMAMWTSSNTTIIDQDAALTPGASSAGGNQIKKKALMKMAAQLRGRLPAKNGTRSALPIVSGAGNKRPHQLPQQQQQKNKNKTTTTTESPTGAGSRKAGRRQAPWMASLQDLTYDAIDANDDDQLP